ncbi:MAG: DUF4231 domain-containing protein [Acidobacteriaceae bacterium]|nr:DUF4231 domain-containing protein [Acidobacteriaceae bacterium]
MSGVEDNPAIARLNDQIAWYDRKSKYNQRAFKLLKGWTIVAAALVPVIAAFGLRDVRIPAALAASIAIVEGIQQLNQYQTNWTLFRSTCEALKHEKFLYLSSAAVYRNADNPVPLLAERIEGLVSQENAKWTSGGEESGKSDAKAH